MPWAAAPTVIYVHVHAHIACACLWLVPVTSLRLALVLITVSLQTLLPSVLPSQPLEPAAISSSTACAGVLLVGCEGMGTEQFKV